MDVNLCVRERKRGRERERVCETDRSDIYMLHANGQFGASKKTPGLVRNQERKRKREKMTSGQVLLVCTGCCFFKKH